MDTPTARGLTPQGFFALSLEGGSMTDAHHATRLAYSTVHRAAQGTLVSAAVARDLAAWSAGVASAQAAGVCIDAAMACGLVSTVAA